MLIIAYDKHVFYPDNNNPLKFVHLIINQLYAVINNYNTYDIIIYI